MIIGKDYWRQIVIALGSTIIVCIVMFAIVAFVHWYEIRQIEKQGHHFLTAANVNVDDEIQLDDDPLLGGNDVNAASENNVEV